jgi:putative transposase
MARRPRLAADGRAHWLLLQALPSRAAFADDLDREAFLAALREAAAPLPLRLHAYALGDDAVHLLLTAAEAGAVSRLVQALGRRYVSAHHRRHGGSGTLWSGRFRSAIVEPGASLLAVLLLLDGLGADAGHSSAGHRLGQPDTRLPLTDPPELWALGNTPFERELAWRRRLNEGLPAAQREALLERLRGNWPVGSAAFAAELAEQLARPTRPRPRGRPHQRSEAGQG